MGRFLCNTLQEALDSAAQTVAGRRRDFDVIVVGGGTFGAVVAEHLFIADSTAAVAFSFSKAGPFVLPEHVQNMPFLGGAPDFRVPWMNHPALNYGGLLFAVGGRSLAWGGWSPEMLDVEMTAWPPATRDALRQHRLFRPGQPPDRRQGNQRLHLRPAPHGAAQAAARRAEDRGQRHRDSRSPISSIIRPSGTRTPASRPIDAALLRDWLDLPPTDTTPEAELREMFKLEAPLAVQSTTLAGILSRPTSSAPSPV